MWVDVISRRWFTLTPDVEWTSCSHCRRTKMAAILLEVEEVSIKLRKFVKYVLKVYPFARAQKNQGVAVKSRCGNTNFTKISYVFN